MATQTTVASVIYSLAGDKALRPDYLKSLVIQNALSRGGKGMGEAINNGYLKGPGMAMRSFHNWAFAPGNYSSVGLPYGRVYGEQNQVSSSTIGANVPVPVTQTYLGGSVFATGLPDPFWWGLHYLTQNRLTSVESNWTYLVDDAVTQLTITLPSSEPSPRTIVVPLTSPAYDPASGYVVLRYTTRRTISGISQDFIRYYLYKAGSGVSAFDALLTSPTPLDPYFPVVPVRISNQFLSGSYKAAAFAQASKGYSRALNKARFSELVASISDNPSLGDIDHAMVVFGVPLNTGSDAGRKYIYAFLKKLQPLQRGGTGAYASWVSSGSVAGNARLNILDVRGSSNHRVYLGWKFITEYTGTGLGKAGAKVDELWVTKEGTITNVGEKIRLYWQRTASSYTYLEVIWLGHRNFIGPLGESTYTYAFEAIDDTEESSLLFPLHKVTLDSLGIVDATQVSSECAFIVFNCAESVETRWYESGVFKILLVVGIAVLSVVFTGGAGIGLLGAHAAIGTALGFSGITAAIVGATVNALAAMVLIALIEPLLNELGAIGPIVGAILMFAIGQAAGSINATGSLAINWGDLLRADNLLSMTSAFGQGLANQVNQDALKLQQSSLDYLEKANAEIEKIQQAFFEKFGYGGGIIDPMLLVDAPKGPIAESSSTFLTRTLMTGSEIAEMSRELLYEFPTYSLKLPDAFT